MKKLTAEELDKLSIDKKSVSIPSINCKHMAAAFLVSMPFRLVMRYINAGVYEYTPKAK